MLWIRVFLLLYVVIKFVQRSFWNILILSYFHESIFVRSCVCVFVQLYLWGLYSVPLLSIFIANFAVLCLSSWLFKACMWPFFGLHYILILHGRAERFACFNSCHNSIFYPFFPMSFFKLCLFHFRAIPMCAINMFYNHWLIKELFWSITWQNIAR